MVQIYGMKVFIVIKESEMSVDHPEFVALKAARDESLKIYPILMYFDYKHLPKHLQDVSSIFHKVAWGMAAVSRNAETSAGLRKLLEAKDCAVRAALG